MKTVCTEAQSLRQRTAASATSKLFFWDQTAQTCVNHLVRGSSLGGRFEDLAGKSVLVATSSQLTAALALIELDGHARRLTILPPDTATDHLGLLMEDAEIDAIVVDDGTAAHKAFDLPVRVVCTPCVDTMDELPAPRAATEWVLLTSGTVGVPKLVVHSLASLTAPIGAGKQLDGAVWGTFYDIRRYGGLQIFLRAILGGASLILSSTGEPVAEHLTRLRRHGVTHLSGTPSHWRRALMSPAIGTISPRYVRLSGEIADQSLLDSLRAMFPEARVGHAYASTEAGVAFEVNDGLVGFPADLLHHVHDGVEMKVVDGSLRIRSPRTASRYLGAQAPVLHDRDGFVDTGDIGERHGDRYMFAGRRGGIINVGGQKVHPEEIELVINRHPLVWMSLVRSKRSPFTGAIVIAEVVLRSAGGQTSCDRQIKNEILELCRRTLSRHKVPAAIMFVPQLDVTTTGKLARRSG